MAIDGSYENTAEGEEIPENGVLSQETENQSQLPAYSVWEAIGKQNITEYFTEGELKDIAANALAEFQSDETDFGPRKTKIEELYKLALQIVEQKNYPWTSASNVKYPLLTKAALAFAALAYPAIVKDGQVVKGKAIGNDDGGEPVNDASGKALIDPDTGKEIKKNAGLKMKRASRVSTFMSWQVLDDMDGWEDDMDKLLHIIAIIGCAYKKTYYDPQERKNVSKLVLPQYLVINATAKTTKSASRLSEYVELYPHEIEESIRAGIFREFDYNMTPSESLEDKYKPNQTPTPGAHSDPKKPHMFIEQHCRIDLDKDGYGEPYILWLHKDTGTVARILPRFDAEHITGNMETGEIVKIESETYYQKFGLFPDPEGSIHDLGFGHYLQHINEAANTSINQLIDAGHRAIMGGGFIGSGFKIKSGDLKFKPGEWKRVDSGGMSIRENAVPLVMPEPSPVLFALVEFLLKAAEDMALTTQIMSGNMPANMPATTALASIEQGLQPFKAIFKRVHRSLKGEFKRLYYLNQKYLSPEEYANVMDDPDANFEKDFNPDDVDVIPLSDPEYVTDIQSMIRAQLLEGYKDDPLVDGVEVRKRIFRAAGIKDAENLVKIPPPVKDELVEAQKAALTAQIKQSDAAIDKMNRDNERADIETALKVEETMAGILLKAAQASKALAEAEAVEGSPDVQVLLKQLDLLKGRMDSYGNVAGRMGRMAPAPDNSQVSQVPA